MDRLRRLDLGDIEALHTMHDDAKSYWNRTMHFLAAFSGCLSRQFRWAGEKGMKSSPSKAPYSLWIWNAFLFSNGHSMILAYCSQTLSKLDWQVIIDGSLRQFHFWYLWSEYHCIIHVFPHWIFILGISGIVICFRGRTETQFWTVSRRWDVRQRS